MAESHRRIRRHASFLALHGLLTALVTSNFVTMGAALVFGTVGAVVKVLALPIFCSTILGTRLAAHSLSRVRLPVLRTMLSLQVMLLATDGALDILADPEPARGGFVSVIAGLLLAAAVVIKNAASRFDLWRGSRRPHS